MTAVLDLRSVTNELGSVIDKWFQIGVQLGLSEAKLHQIEFDHRTADRCFSEVIIFWLKGNTQVAMIWKSLVEVLESSFVNERGLAMRLREKLAGEMEAVGKAASIGQLVYTLYNKHIVKYMYVCILVLHCDYTRSHATD